MASVSPFALPVIRLMTTQIRILLSCLLIVSLVSTVAAQPRPPAPPQPAVEAFFLMDHHTGRVLAGSNADEPLPPASLAKIVTAYTVFRELEAGNIGLDDEVLISEKAWRTKGSRTFVEVGSRVSVEDLLMGMIVQSGNDASVALAEHIAGSERTFADMMNAHARRLGATNSHFTNATGLPSPDLYTTARDIALFASALIREFPEQYARYSVQEFTYNEIKQRNRNLLLYRDASVDGVKTGYTAEAGHCLVSSAARDGMRLVAVVMGAAGPRQRADDSLALLNYGFRFFETPLLYTGGEPVERLRIWKGAATEVPVGPEEDVYVTIPRGQYGQLSAGLAPREPTEAPIERGNAMGAIVVRLGDRDIRRVPVVALRDVERGGLWRQLVDTVMVQF